MEDQEPLLVNKACDTDGYNVSEKERNDKDEDGSQVKDTLPEYGRGAARCGRSCRFVVEPVFVIYYFVSLPAWSLSSQLVYHQMASERHLLNATRTDYCGVVKNDSSPDAGLRQLETEVDHMTIYLDLAQSLPNLFTLFFMGPFSDRYGRKIPLVMAIVGTTASCVCHALVSWFNLSVYFLFIGTFLDGLMGSTYGMEMGAFSYLSDTTDSQQRSLRLVLLDSLAMLANAGSLIIAGYLAKSDNFALPYAGMGALLGLTLLYTVIVVPEIIHRNPNQTTSSLSAHAKSMAKLFTKQRPNNDTQKLWMLLGGFTILQIAVLGKAGVDPLYKLYPPLCWNSKLIGYYLGSGYISHTVASLVLLRICMNRVGDDILALVGCVCYLAGMVFQAFADTTLLMFIVLAVSLFDKMGINLFKSLMSKVVQQEERGTLFGCVAAMDLVVYSAFGAVFRVIYAVTLHVFRGLILLVAAFITVGSCVIIGIYIIRERRCKTSSSIQEDGPIEQHR